MKVTEQNIDNLQDIVEFYMERNDVDEGHARLIVKNLKRVYKTDEAVRKHVEDLKADNNMDIDFTSKVKLRVPFTGYVDYEVEVMKSDHEFEDAKQVVLMNCGVVFDNNGRLAVKGRDDVGISILDFDLNKLFDVKNAEPLE